MKHFFFSKCVKNSSENNRGIKNKRNKRRIQTNLPSSLRSCSYFAFKHSATTLTCVTLPENDSLYHLASE